MNVEDPVPAEVQRVESPVVTGNISMTAEADGAESIENNSVRDMDSQQEALIVSKTAATTQGLQELNNRLKRGWRVVQAVPMGGSSGGGVLAALVVIQRDEDTAGAVMEAEEEVEEVVEEIVEGNGSEKGIAEELGEERNGGA